MQVWAASTFLRSTFKVFLLVTMEAYKARGPLRQYILDHSIRLTKEQEKLRQLTETHDRGIMLGSLDAVQLVHNLVFAINARKVLDVGVFTGYSALAEALAMPEDGKVIACDISEEYANIGRPYWERAGVAHKIQLKIGKATDTLDRLIAAGEGGTFDFALIDADKDGYSQYYEKCLTLVRPRGIIAIDNVISGGTVAEPNYSDGGQVESIRKLNDFVKDDPRVKVSMLNVGDGMTLAIKC